MIKACALSAAILIPTISSIAADWPQWRGPDRNAISKEQGLLQAWPKDGPPLAWKVTGIGDGMGGIAVSNGRIYTTGDSDGSAWLFALNEADGKQVWKAKIGRGGQPGFIFKPFGPRATPTVDGDRIHILGQYGEFVCFTTEGKEVWRTDFVEDLGGIVPVWGYSESPLVDGDRIICTPGGSDATLVAIDKETAKPVWKCKVPEGPTNRRYGNESSAGYSSAIAIDFEGIRQYAQLTATTLVGIAASDGKLLWRYDRAANTHRIPCSTPLFHDGLVFAASAYDAGGGAVKLSKEPNGNVTATEVYFAPSMKNHHGGMIVVDGCLYGAAGGNEGGFLVCLDFRTGDIQWRDRRAPKGSLALADGRLYLRAEDGTMILIEPNCKEYIERGRFEQPDRTREPAWTHPVIANGKLYVRDQDLLLCYDIKVR
ncbi:MAG: PQQ-like beta-propeller repeat protein [Phycisphaerae bacterium]|nr:PQQ-like beta-propeller repeat protein [Phycisphaerae bacterium]